MRWARGRWAGGVGASTAAHTCTRRKSSTIVPAGAPALLTIEEDRDVLAVLAAAAAATPDGTAHVRVVALRQRLSDHTSVQGKEKTSP